MKIFDNKNICLWRCHFSLHRFKSLEIFWTISQGYCACFGFFLSNYMQGEYVPELDFVSIMWNGCWRKRSRIRHEDSVHISCLFIFTCPNGVFCRIFSVKKKMCVRKFLVYYTLMIFFLYEPHLYIIFFLGRCFCKRLSMQMGMELDNIDKKCYIWNYFLYIYHFKNNKNILCNEIPYLRCVAPDFTSQFFFVTTNFSLYQCFSLKNLLCMKLFRDTSLLGGSQPLPADNKKGKVPLKETLIWKRTRNVTGNGENFKVFE